jgi:hypothetical protein
VTRLGPRVREHTAWLHRTYPGATTDGLIRLATHRLVRQARRQGAAAGLGGILTVDTAAVAWTQAELVLQIAAAHGLDPTEPRRAAELLTLWRLYPDLPAAQLAVDEAPQRLSNGHLSGRLAAHALRGVPRASAFWRVARLIPGAAAVLNAFADARSTERLATGAARFYRMRATGG